MFLFLDIGFTLLGGPSVGPARRLADALQLSGEAKSILSKAMFRTPFRHPEELADRIISDFASDPDQTYHEVRQLWQAQNQEAYPLPGATEFIAHLHANNIPFAFISNIWSPFYAGFCRLFPYESRTCPSFLSFECNLVKPELALYQKALDEVGVDAHQAIMIGDTYEMDIAPAQQLGMKTVWILHRPEKELSDIVKILNGGLQGHTSPAHLTVANIGQLQVNMLDALLQESPKV